MRERDFIKKIRNNLRGRAGAKAIMEIGDDCAIIEYTKKTCILLTVDSLVEGTHFSRKYFTPREIGARAMAVNISDICAMGGIPKYALVAVGFPGKEKQAYVDAVYSGLAGYAENYGVRIIGGDTVGSPIMFLSVTLTGEAEKKSVLTRGGAGAGDIMYVTGLLGDSCAGLKVLQKKGRERLKPWEYLPVKKHIVPLPRYMEGRMLSLSGCVSSCIDISDGLINDALNIAEESGKGAVINADMLPVSHSASMVAARMKDSAADYALYGGEDYELLFTVPAAKNKRFQKFMAAAGVKVFEVGRITAGRGVKIERNGRLKKADLTRVWNHF